MKAALTSRSSTSSSEATAQSAVAVAEPPALPVAADQPLDRCALAAPRVSTMARPPLGALAACLTVAVVHVVVATWVISEPVATERLRQRFLALSPQGCPSIVIAGDSRAAWQVTPETIASTLGRPPHDVVNLGLEYCESATVLAAYREFADRFAPAPIMLLSVSFWTLNDHPRGGSHHINDTTLWDLGLVDRLRIVPPKQAVLAEFLPERTLWRRFTARLNPPANRVVPQTVEDRDFHIVAAPDEVAALARTLAEGLFAGAKTDGVCWRQFEVSLQGLKEAGVQVVLLDTPEHPAFLAAIEGTAKQEAYERYHARLAELSRRAGIPLLRYHPARFAAADPNMLYGDVLHLNRTGAGVLSEWIGQSLRHLIADGVLRGPAPAVRSVNNR